MFPAIHIIQTGDWNPHCFNYPGFLFYANAAIDAAHYVVLMGVGPWSPGYLGSLDRIECLGRSGSASISHPSFVAWNRTLTVVLGTLSIPATYFLGEAAFGIVAGLIGALAISCLSLHVAHSRFVTTDVPMVLFVILAALFSVRYATCGHGRDHVLACVFAGMVVSTKYSGAPVLLLPALALARRPRWRLALVLAIVPGAVFAAFDPYAFLDFGSFLRGAGYEVHHYKVLGHETAEVYPGFAHLRLQAPQLVAEMSPWLFYPALAGAVLALARLPAGPLMLAFPIVELAFICSQRASFHRNFLVLYPFLVLFLGHFVGAGSRLAASSLHRRLGARAPAEPRLRAMLVLAAFCVVGLTQGIPSLRRLRLPQPESRSRAVALVNDLARRDGRRDLLVGIASHVALHPLDRRRLGPFEEIDTADMPAALARCDYLVVTKIASRDRRGRIRRRNAQVDLLDPAWIAARIDGPPVALDEPVKDPNAHRPAASMRIRDGLDRTRGFLDGGAWMGAVATCAWRWTSPMAREASSSTRGEHRGDRIPRRSTCGRRSTAEELVLRTADLRALSSAAGGDREGRARPQVAFRPRHHLPGQHRHAQARARRGGDQDRVAGSPRRPRIHSPASFANRRCVDGVGVTRHAGKIGAPSAPPRGRGARSWLDGGTNRSSAP
ncbi:MAG: glycosyltransferase family 39 protein [Acidobacteriota bacterium]